jgi:hypothetical protein
MPLACCRFPDRGRGGRRERVLDRGVFRRQVAEPVHVVPDPLFDALLQHAVLDLHRADAEPLTLEIAAVERVRLADALSHGRSSVGHGGRIGDRLLGRGLASEGEDGDRGDEA